MDIYLRSMLEPAKMDFAFENRFCWICQDCDLVIITGYRDVIEHLKVPGDTAGHIIWNFSRGANPLQFQLTGQVAYRDLEGIDAPIMQMELRRDCLLEGYEWVLGHLIHHRAAPLREQIAARAQPRSSKA